jgi:hypothetical protein
VKSFGQEYGFPPSQAARTCYVQTLLYANACETAGTFYPPEVIKTLGGFEFDGMGNGPTEYRTRKTYSIMGTNSRKQSIVVGLYEDSIFLHGARNVRGRGVNRLLRLARYQDAMCDGGNRCARRRSAPAGRAGRDDDAARPQGVRAGITRAGAEMTGLRGSCTEGSAKAPEGRGHGMRVMSTSP